MKRKGKKGRVRWIGALLCAVCLAGAAGAVEPTLWREDTQDAFAGGEPEGISITRDGVVTLAPAFEEVADTEEQFVWALAEGPNGRLYIATGNRGRIFALSGKGTPELLFDSPEVAIFSLAVDAGGVLFAGSSPDGLIYRIAPGKDPVTLCRTGDEHVWALAPDGKGGLFAATGGAHGRILRVSSKGKVEELYQAPDHNLVSLVRGADGTLYAGTDENGLVYRLDGSGKVEVLYDAVQKEIHALALGPDGMLYAGAMSGRSQPERSKPPGPPQKVKKEETSVLYAIRASGAAYRLWETNEPLLLALSVGSDGEITVVTGGKGRVYRVGSDGTATLLIRMADVQPWAFAPSAGGEIWVGTSGAGKVYRLGKTYAREGTLTSKPRDFHLVSKWGRLAWKADRPEGTSVSFQTRSGNSEEPDDTWSAWSDPLAQAGQISSPPARFLQYRARLASEAGRATPRLQEVTLAGLQENIQPLILTLDASPMQGQDKGSGGGGGKNGKKGRNPASEAGKGIWKIAWSAGDANNDQLVYTLYFRGRDEKGWKLLEEEITATSYQWNTESAPDGTMQVRLVASDRLSNPAPRALSAEKVSGPFDIDHTAPAVRLTALRQTGPGAVSVEGSVEDVTSAVRQAAYALNSGPWEVLFPADQIFDSRVETLRFTVDQLGPGEYTLVVRAVDALGNIGVDKRVFEVK